MTLQPFQRLAKLYCFELKSNNILCFCSCGDDLYHLSHVLHGRDLTHLELHSELTLYSVDERDVLQTVPIVNVVCRCLGIDSYVLSVVQICEVMGSLGTTIYGNREIAYVRKDPDKLTRTFWELLFLRLSLGVIVGAIYLFIAFHSAYKIVFLIQTITLVSYYLDVSWMYIGLEDVRPVTLYSAFAKITATIAVFVLIKDPSDLYLYVFLIASSQAVITLLLFSGCNGRIGRCRLGQLNIKRHLRPVIALFLPQAASSLYVLFDKTMIGLLASDMSRTSIYDKAEMIVKAPVVFAVAMTTVMMPRIANYYAENRMDDIRGLVHQSLDLMLLLFVPISAGMAIVARIFVLDKPSVG